MKKIGFVLCTMSMFAFFSCSDDDTDLGSLIEESENIEDEIENEYDILSIEFDTTPLEEVEEEFAEDDNDYVENSDFTRIVYIDFDGDTATATGEVSRVGIDIDGAHVTVASTSKKMEYVLRGESDNGSFKIAQDDANETKIKMTLDGLTLKNPTGAAINNQYGKSLYIVLNEGTENTLTDGTSYTLTDGEDMKGTIFSEGQIIFSGNGTLNVYSNYKNGIVSDDYIVFRPGNVINVTSTSGNGIKANDGVFINGSVINVGVSANGAKGINSEYNVDIKGGRTTIITSGGTKVEGIDTTGVAGVKCDMWFLMSGGELNIKSTGEGGKGINCNGDITFNGGELNVVTLGIKSLSAPKGIKADGLIDLSVGSVYSYSANSKPIDAGTNLTIADGYTTYTNEERLFELRY